MKTVFTKSEMILKKGCYSTEKLMSLSFMNSDEITIESILDSEISLKDKSWFIRNSCELTISEKREFAIGCALVVLPIYENKYPNNSAPRKAIEAAKLYLNNEISLEGLKVFNAAAAAAAADAAYAADAAAADAAYAAYAAADAYAAYAAADAADAAYAAAYAAADGYTVNYKDLLLIFFKKFFELN
jgi:hypothetical protein